MLKGHVFKKQVFGNQIFALFINTFLDGQNGISNNYKNGMKPTYSGSTVTVDSGAVCIQGRFLEEDTSSTIAAGTDSAFCKLVIEIDLDQENTESDFAQGTYKIIKGVNTYPNLTQTDIVKNNSGVYQYELARFKTSANGITNFSDRRTFLNFDSIYNQISQMFEEQKEDEERDFQDLLDRMQDEIDGVVDRSGLFLNSNIKKIEGTVQLAKNSSGNYEGYAQFEYPSGYTFENTMIVSISAVNAVASSYSDIKTYGSFSTAQDEYNTGYCETKIMQEASGFTIFLLSKGSSESNTINVNYEVLLLKVPEGD